MAKKGKKAAVKRLSALTRRIVLIVFGFSGAAALIYEVTWTRLLSLVFGSSVYAVSTMLTAFMAGLSLGSFIAGRYADRLKDRLLAFGLVETGIGICGILSLYAIHWSEGAYYSLFRSAGGSFTLFIAGQFLLGFALMLLPTTLMGATFPLASRIFVEDLEAVGREVSDLYSINTLGSILGSFAAGFILIPLVGVNAAVAVAALVNLLGGGAVLLLAGRARMLGITGLLLIPLVYTSLLGHPSGFAYNLHTAASFSDFEVFNAYRDGMNELFYRDDENGQVAVLEGQGTRFLRVAGKTEGSTGKEDMPTQTLAGALPVELMPKPIDRALVIGLGTGVTLGAMCTDEVRSIDCAEINPSVIDAAGKYFSRESRGAIDSSKVNFKMMDGRNWLLVTNDKYDIISSEPSYPTSQGVANLFTDEFYALAKKRLKPGGILCQWAPVYIFGQKEYEILAKTIGRHFKRNLLVYNIGSDALILCSDSELKPQEELLRDILRQEELPVPEIKSWLLDAALLAQLQQHEEITLNSDDSAELEYRAFRNVFDGAVASWRDSGLIDQPARNGTK